MFKVQIVTQRDCLICKSYLNRLDKQHFIYTIYDADDPNNQKQLDVWKIEEMPVVQIVNGEDVTFQFPRGSFSPRVINHKISLLEKKHGHRY